MIIYDWECNILYSLNEFKHKNRINKHFEINSKGKKKTTVTPKVMQY